MKNILIAQIHGIGTVAKGVMLEVLQDMLNQYPESNVYYLSCSNSFNVCHVNVNKIPETCYLCKQGIKKGIDLIDKDLIHLKIDDLININDEKEANDFLQLNPVVDKKLKYKDYFVGEAAISSYISKSRDRDMVNVDKSFIKDIVRNDVIFYNALDRFFQEKKIDKVYNFNGRNSYQKAVLSTSIKYGIDCTNMEVARPGGYLEIFKNVIPHDINAKTNLINEAWNKSQLEIGERREIGASFFEKKINNENLNDKVYTKDQIKNQLPTGINYTKKTYVLFTSSDDEFAAVGKEYDNPLFKDQNDGIKYIIEIFSKILIDCNLVIRMHPNLKGIQFDYVRELRDMGENLSNVNVIFPESPVDTYALLKIAEKVIVFGSTIGVEATYWKKPVILLGKSFYYKMNIAYIPDNKNDIVGLLTNNLLPKSNEDALKLGYYFMRGGEKSNNYNNNAEKNVFFKGVELYKYSIIERIIAKLIHLFNKYLKIRILVK